MADDDDDNDDDDDDEIRFDVYSRQFQASLNNLTPVCATLM